MPQRMNLNEIEQEVTISYTVQCLLCLINNVKNGVSWIHRVHFEVAIMRNIPTHSPEIPLRRKFSCLSARVVWSSSVSAMIAAASCSPQFSICISLAPLRSSAIASSFLGGVPYNQHHYHHSSSSKKKWQQRSFWKDVSSRVLKIQRLYGTQYPLFAKAREIAARTGNSNQKKCDKGATGQPANLKTVTENTQSIPTTLWDHTTCTIASWFVSGVPFTAMCVSLV